MPFLTIETNAINKDTNLGEEAAVLVAKALGKYALHLTHALSNYDAKPVVARHLVH